MYSNKCHNIFQSEWFNSKNYKLWIAKTKYKKTTRCTLCQKEIDLSTMGSDAIDSHAIIKKYTEMNDCKQGSDQMFFNSLVLNSEFIDYIKVNI